MMPPSRDACQGDTQSGQQQHGATLPCDTPLTPGGIGSGHGASLPCSAKGTVRGPCPLLKDTQTPRK